MRTITHIVVHHNGHPGRTIDDIRRSHRGFGWIDIGYHFVVHEDGSVHVGRAVGRTGAHARGFNRRTLGVCVVGNGNEADFNDTQYTALAALLRALMASFGIPSEHVIGHREVNEHVSARNRARKSCPGSQVDMDALRGRLG